MRQLLTIFHYELLMQFKSIRFKATCLLAGLIAFGFYTDGVRYQEMPNFRESLLSFPALAYYVVAIAVTGLFAIGRIRSTGMHSILMTKPFPTFALLMGQLLAGLVALLVPLFILLFPSGLVLHWEYDVDFAWLPLLHIILIFMIPLICCVLAVTIWVRTCFKSNLVAIIILALFFIATTVLGNKYLNVRVPSPDGGVETVHRFVPLASYFCKDYWEGRMRVLEQPRITFTNREDWINWASSLLYCNVFLMLGGYHLRRTEPQRKVLGTYGRHWYHAPTFLRIAADLKIDPNVTWRHHLVLAGMVGVIFMRTIWPMLPQDLGARAMTIRNAGKGDDQLDAKNFPENRILPIKIYDDAQLLTPSQMTEDLTVSVEGETSGTMCILDKMMRWRYDPRTITIDGHPLAFRSREDYLFIDGRLLEPFADHGKHKLHVEAVYTTAQNMSAADSLYDFIAPSGGFRFALKKDHFLSSAGNGEMHYYFSTTGQKRFPRKLSIEKPVAEQLLFSRRPPAIRPNGPFTRYDFEFTTQSTDLGSTLFFASADSYVTLEAANPTINLRMSVPREYQQTGKDLLELAQPVLEDFCKLHDLATTTPLFFLSPFDHNQEDDQLLKKIRKYQNIYRYRGYFYNYSNRDEKEEFMKLLKSFEKSVLRTVFIQEHNYERWDSYEFFEANFSKGLNHRLVQDKQYEAPEYSPLNAHMDAKSANTLKTMNRPDCLNLKRSRWPVFQMLYLILGHEKYQALTKRLKDVTNQPDDQQAIDTLQAHAEAVAGEKLGWFFDYWMRGGRDFPSYQVVSATGKLDASREDNKTQYTVRAVIKNLGTGRMPVPLRLTTNKTDIDGKMWIGEGESVTWTVTCKELPKSVAVDPEGWIMTRPYWVEQNKNWISTTHEEVKME